ncbi:MAG: DUF58 domain-containing protein [Rhodothermales bacterium]
MIPKELFKKIRRIEIRTKGLVNNVFGGEYHSAFKGRGIEFSEVRPYQFGDDIRSIDWNVSARTGDPYVKVFEEEREQTVMLVVDVSGSEDFGSQTHFKREVAAEICAIVGFSAISNNDKVGLLLVSDQIELFVPPKKGRRHVLRLLRDLFAHEPASRGTDLSVALNHILHVLSRHSIVLLMSDFMDDGFAKPLRVVARRHDTIAVHLIDPREENLPSMGLLELTDAETDETVVIDTGSRRTREAFAWQARRRRTYTQELFRRIRMDYVPIHTDEGYVEPLIRFFRHRNKTSR